MFRLFWTVIQALPSAFRSRRDLLLENLALRQQLAAFKSRGRQPQIRTADRVFWIALRGLWARWAGSLVMVTPDTVVRWHRSGFKILWSWRSHLRHRRRGRPRVSREVQELIRRMAIENGWRAPRIHGELRMLGFDVSERTISRYLRRLPGPPHRRQSWLTFLRNHREVIAAMDFMVVSTLSCRLLWVLFIIRHGRRQLVHFNVSANPTSAWVVQQLREAFPFDSGPKYLVFDRSSIFSAAVASAIRGMGAKPIRTAHLRPWQNGVAERWVGSCRRELLDHVVVLNEAHLMRLLHEYVGYHNQDRTHCGLSKQAPVRRRVDHRPSPGAKVIAHNRVGGLHHRYAWRAVA